MSDETTEEEKNLLDDWARIVGLVLMAIVALLALALAGWVYWNRESSVVKAMQPIFLFMLCFGTLIQICTLVPLGMDDENTPNVDAACTAYIWLNGLGSTFILSALFSKLWRVNKVRG